MLTGTANGIPHRTHIAHIVTRLIVGGAQLTTLAVCEALEADHDVTLVCGPETGVEGSLHDQVPDGVRLVVVPSLRRGLNPPADLRAVVHLRAVLDDLEPQIVHTHSSKAGIVGRAAARPRRMRIVHSVHGWGHTPLDSYGRRAAFVGLERAMALRSASLVAVSEDVLMEGRRRHIGRPEQWRVIPECVDTKPARGNFGLARQEARTAFGGIDGPVVGWVGRFVAQKDPATLAAALGGVLAADPTTTAILVGDGPQRGPVQASLEPFGDRVRFLGLRPDVRSLYAGFDVLLHPSLWEGQPRVVQEALAERVPVVAARVAGVSDLIRDGLSGFVVEPSDPGAMSRCALQVLRDPTLRAPLDTAATTHLEAVAGAELSIHAHRRLYAELLRR